MIILHVGLHFKGTEITQNQSTDKLIAVLLNVRADCKMKCERELHGNFGISVFSEVGECSRLVCVNRGSTVMWRHLVKNSMFVIDVLDTAP